MTLFGVRPEAALEDYPLPATRAPVPLIGHWAYLGVYVPAGLMHAEDAARYLSGGCRGESLYECIREDGPFAVLRNNIGFEFRVNPHRVIWIPTPRFALGEAVRATVGSMRTGWIATRDWHLKHQRLHYLMDIEKIGGRRRHTRRYWEEELEGAAVPPATRGD